MRIIVRRLLTGPGALLISGDGGSALGSGFIVGADGLIVDEPSCHRERTHGPCPVVRLTGTARKGHRG